MAQLLPEPAEQGVAPLRRHDLPKSQTRLPTQANLSPNASERKSTTKNLLLCWKLLDHYTGAIPPGRESKSFTYTPATLIRYGISTVTTYAVTWLDLA